MKYPMSRIKVDPTYQHRVEALDYEHFIGIVRAIEANPAHLDDYPIDLAEFEESDGLFVINGHHRFEAACKLGMIEIPAVVHRLTKSQAIEFVARANDHIGSPLKRTRADRQKSIKAILSDPDLRRKLDVDIAEICGVDKKTVGNIRRSNPAWSADVRVTKTGEVFVLPQSTKAVEIPPGVSRPDHHQNVISTFEPEVSPVASECVTPIIPAQLPELTFWAKSDVQHLSNELTKFFEYGLLSDIDEIISVFETLTKEFRLNRRPTVPKIIPLVEQAELDFDSTTITSNSSSTEPESKNSQTRKRKSAAVVVRSIDEWKIAISQYPSYKQGLDWKKVCSNVRGAKYLSKAQKDEIKAWYLEDLASRAVCV